MNFDQLNEAPNYGLTEAAMILRLNTKVVRNWIKEGVINVDRKGLSFVNILELHILKGLRKETQLPMQRIRRALEEYGQTESTAHPLLDTRLETDGVHMFLHEGDEYFNLNRSRQMGIPQILSVYLKRIDRLKNGELIYFPFIAGETADEPRTIQMSPRVAFGRPVLAETGITADIIVGRFRARDTVAELAEEYGVPAAMIEDCVRWELPQSHVA